MSLEYSGYHVHVVVNPERHAQTVETKGFSEPTGDALEDKKKAFMQAMEEFVNHPKFDELTSQMMDEFPINVTTLVSTSMP